jgi:hypothetical protein
MSMHFLRWVGESPAHHARGTPRRHERPLAGPKGPKGRREDDVTERMARPTRVRMPPWQIATAFSARGKKSWAAATSGQGRALCANGMRIAFGDPREAPTWRSGVAQGASHDSRFDCPRGFCHHRSAPTGRLSTPTTSRSRPRPPRPGTKRKPASIRELGLLHTLVDNA